MATVAAFRIEGLKLWFWSQDHEPPHFHAKRAGEWEVKVQFMLAPANMIEVECWSRKRPPRKLLQQISPWRPNTECNCLRSGKRFATKKDVANDP